MKRTKEDRQEAREMLNKFVSKGDTIYTVLRHVSRSGMQRRIDLYVIKDGRPYYLSGYAACLMGWSLGRGARDGIVVNGCGMDMGFHLVNNLSMELYCPDKYDHDAAYSLKHEWL